MSDESDDFKLTGSLLEEAQQTLMNDTELSSMATSISVDVAGSRLGKRAEPDVENLGGSPLWQQFLEEKFLFICTKDKKYKKLRKRLKTADTTFQEGVIPVIAGGIGASLGVGAAVLVPSIALGILGLAQLGTNAWCARRSDVAVRGLIDADGKPVRLITTKPAA
jgi:hypothetical protein